MYNYSSSSTYLFLLTSKFYTLDKDRFFYGGDKVSHDCLHY